MSEWLDRAGALNALQVRPQTLYAYVSRGRIGMMPDPADPRRSLYRAADIADLTVRRARGRKVARVAASTIAWGEPSITTSISTVRHGRLIYRGEDAAAWASAATLEDTARLLWNSAGPVAFPAVEPAGAGPFQALAALIPISQPTLGRNAERLQRDAAGVIGHLGASLGLAAAPGLAHERLAGTWGLGTADAVRIRQALVLLADHELNASTFAARVAASTGASLAASLLAGMSALSGPRHGGAGAAVLTLIDDASRSGADRAVAAWLARGEQLPGFGHPLYPEGDLRATMLLRDLAVEPLSAALGSAVHAATGALPNIDFALAVLTRSLDLPRDAPLSLFMLGRSVGWAAHAMEQITTGGLIRPRAHYDGPEPRVAANQPSHGFVRD